MTRQSARRCARPGCSAAAAATLAYDYQQRITWLDPLAAEPHPMSYDLCDPHAGALVVPRGWRLDDRRPAPAAGSGTDGAHTSFAGALAF